MPSHIQAGVAQHSHYHNIQIAFTVVHYRLTKPLNSAQSLPPSIQSERAMAVGDVAM